MRLQEWQRGRSVFPWPRWMRSLLPGHPRDQLQRALRIPALSAGWKGSLRSLAAADEQGGNAGLAPSSAPPPAWVGFRPLRIEEVRARMC